MSSETALRRIAEGMNTWRPHPLTLYELTVSTL